MIRAVPALLNATVSELEDQIEKLKPYFSYFQIDICDGTLFPNSTAALEDVVSFLSNSSKNQQISFDFDLMVDDFPGAIDTLYSSRNEITIKNVFVHSAALKLTPIPTKKKLIIGLAIDPDTEIDTLYRQYNINEIPSLQIMTVNPGFQGNPFLPKMLNKIEQLRKGGYRNDIYIDGSVNTHTIPEILQRYYKPQFLGIGSFLTRTENITESVQFLTKNGISCI